MSVSATIDKMAAGILVSELERGELRREMENMDRAAKLVNSWIIPGSSVPYIRDLKTSNVRVDSGEIQLGSGNPGDGFSGVRIAFPAFSYNGEDWNIAGVENDVFQVGFRASDGVLVAGAGKVIVGNGGISILKGEANQSYIVFYNAAGTDSTHNIKTDGISLMFQAEDQGGSILATITTTNSETPGMDLKEDVTHDNRFHVNLSVASQGTLFSLDNEFLIYAQGGSGGQTYIAWEQTVSTPTAPDGTRPNFYVRNNKFIMQFFDGATTRYKYLDLTGTGVTWVHTTTAP